MAKILLSFHNGVKTTVKARGLPCFYDAFVKGLCNAGNEVLIYHSYGFRPPDDVETEEIKQALSVFNPDVVIAFNNHGPDFSKLCECPILIYEVDSPLCYENKEAIKLNPSRYRYVISQESSRDAVNNSFGVPADDMHFIPFFSEVVAEDVDKTANIAFIGSTFGFGDYHWDCFVRPPFTFDKCRKKKYLELVNELRVNPFVNINSLLDRYSELVNTQKDVNNIINSLSRSKRILTLAAVSDLGLELFGPEDWILDGNSSTVELHCAYNLKQIYSLKQNQDLYNSSKIGLNINHLQAQDGFSWRVLDIMASSACLVSEFTPNIKRFFPDIPIPTFTNAFEARRECQCLLKDDVFRKELTLMCQQEVDARFRFKHVLPRIEEIVGMSLNSPMEGRVSFIEAGRGFDFEPLPRKVIGITAFKLALGCLPGLDKFFKFDKRMGRLLSYAKVWRKRLYNQYQREYNLNLSNGKGS